MSATVRVRSQYVEGDVVLDADGFRTDSEGELWVSNGGRSVAVFADQRWTSAELVKPATDEPATDEPGAPR